MILSYTVKMFGKIVDTSNKDGTTRVPLSILQCTFSQLAKGFHKAKSLVFHISPSFSKCVYNPSEDLSTVYRQKSYLFLFQCS